MWEVFLNLEILRQVIAKKKKKKREGCENTVQIYQMELY